MLPISVDEGGYGVLGLLKSGQGNVIPLGTSVMKSLWSKLSLLCVGVVKVHPLRDTSCAINCHYLSKEGRDSGIPD
jgi:hypothetical protein